MKFPLRVKLILAICLPLLAVYLTVLTLDYRSSKQEALTQMENYLTEVTAHEALVLDEQLSPIAQVARSTAQFLQTFAHREGADRERLARANLLAEPQLFGFGVVLGNLDVQVEGIRSQDELGQFAATFNQMVIDLNQRTERDQPVNRSSASHGKYDLSLCAGECARRGALRTERAPGRAQATWGLRSGNLQRPGWRAGSAGWDGVPDH